MKCRKLTTALLAVVLAAGMTMFTGCGKKSKVNPDDDQTLQVYVYSAGYGHAWCQDILNAFKEEDWVKEKYPRLVIDFHKDELETSAKTYMSSGKANPYEVVFGQGLTGFMGPTAESEDLTESVYNSKVPGEDITVKEKMNASALLSNAYNSLDADSETRYYTMSYAGGMTGLVYNATRLEALGKSVPNTTDELVQIMKEVKALGGKSSAYQRDYSFLTYGSSTYVDYFVNTLWGQYEGYDSYVNFFNGIDPDTNSYSTSIFHQQGRLEALEVIESIMSKDLGYTYQYPDTSRSAYMSTQTQLLLGFGLFMANGDWFDNEMRNTYEGLVKRNGSCDIIKLMKTPVISSIIDKTPTINDDATLSAVVAAIDRGETSYGNVSAEDFNTVLKARSVVYSIGPGHNAVIPKYAAAKEVAIDFLRYMATDKANEIYIRATKGASLPFNYDCKEKNPELFESLSPLQKDRLEYFNNFMVEPEILPAASSFPLVRFGGLTAFKSCGFIGEQYTSGKSKGEYPTLAEKIYRDDIAYWEKGSNWSDCLNAAGV